jgi:type IV secretion system protein VirD4
MRIVLAILALLLAWHFGPATLALLVIVVPAAASVLGFLMPDFTGQSFAFYLQVIITGFLFWWLLRAALFVFSFALPEAARFTNTKLVRRMQGVAAELAIVGLFSGIGIAVLEHTVEGRAASAAVHEEASRLLGPTPPEFGPGSAAIRQAMPGYPADLADIAAAEARYEWVDTQLDASPLWRKWLYLKVSPEVRGGLFTSSILLYVMFGWLLKRVLARLQGGLMRFVEAGRFGFGGSARFASLVEEWPLRRRTIAWPWSKKVPSLFMGRSLYNRFLHVGLQDDRHMLTIAGSRAGKGACCIIPNLLTWEGSAIVIDPKGTNAAVTAQRRRAMGHDVYVVDPFHEVIGHLGRAESDGFNPLTAVDLNSRTVREQIGVLADALVVREKAAPNQKHWDDGALTMARGLITQLLSGDYKDPSLPMLRDLLAMPPKEQDGLWVKMLRNKAAGGGARDAASRIFAGAGTEEIQNILSNVNKHTEWLSSAPVADVLSRSTFAFSQLREKPTTVYLVLPLGALKEHNRFLRLFINMAIMQMSTGGRSKVPVLMMLDEFLTLGHMSEVEKAFVFMAGYNLTVWPFVQDYGQLEELYGGAVSSFVTNSRAVQVFGVSDSTSTGFVSEQIGKRSMRHVWGMAQLRSEMFRQPDEVAKEVARETGQQYILRAGKAPLLLEKVRYFEDGNGPTDAVPGSFSEVIKQNIERISYPFRGLYGKDPDYSA